MKPTTRPIDSSRREFLKTNAIALSVTAFNRVTRGMNRAMETDVIPMLNAWRHAATSRINYGRYVALDQNPQFAPLFHE
jgi:hypothetical protein